MMKNRTTTALVGLAALVAGLTGCATSSDIDKKIAVAQAETEKKLDAVEGQVEELQAKQKQTDSRLDNQGQEIEKLSKSAQEALTRAQEAGVLAKGRVVFQQTFTEDRIKFKVDSAELDDAAKAALDEFAKKVKELGKGFYFEIQGHTDNRGGEERNDLLGERRAEAVKRYLARTHMLPIPRMSTISYGETMPVEDNKTSKGRAANRRVVVIVLE
jgi:peptidoglycan-associated lipoprotein